MRNNLFANWILSMFHWSLTSKWYLLHYTKTYFIGLNTLKKVPFVVQKHANCVYIPIGIYKWANLYLTLRNSEKNLAITSTSTIIIYGRILFSSANGIHVNCSTCVCAMPTAFGQNTILPINRPKMVFEGEQKAKCLGV